MHLCIRCIGASVHQVYTLVHQVIDASVHWCIKCIGASGIHIGASSASMHQVDQVHWCILCISTSGTLVH